MLFFLFLFSRISLSTSTHSSESEIGSDQGFKSVFHRVPFFFDLPTVQVGVIIAPFTYLVNRVQNFFLNNWIRRNTFTKPMANLFVFIIKKASAAIRLPIRYNPRPQERRDFLGNVSDWNHRFSYINSLPRSTTSESCVTLWDIFAKNYFPQRSTYSLISAINLSP